MWSLALHDLTICPKFYDAIQILGNDYGHLLKVAIHISVLYQKEPMNGPALDIVIKFVDA